MPEWEHVVGDPNGDTWRLKVPNGWIYRHETTSEKACGNLELRPALVFVPQVLRVETVAV